MKGAIAGRGMGMTLMECVLAMGLIALALPAVMMVLAQSQSNSRDLLMHGEAQRIIAVHAHELTGEGVLQSEPIIWTHAADGECLGRVDGGLYVSGFSHHNGRPVHCLVAAHPLGLGDSGLRQVRLTLEYPPSAPADRRRNIDFHTQIRP